MIKTFRKTELEGNFLGLIRIIYKMSTLNIILNGERLNAFPIRQKKTRIFTLTSLIQHNAGSSSPCIKARKGNKSNTD